MKLKPVIFYSLIFLLLFFPYFQITLWKYLLSCSLILLLFYWFDREHYKERLGLSFQKTQIPFFFIIFLTTAVSTEILIQSLLPGTNVSKDYPLIAGFWVLQPLTQSLNEEMLMRSLFFYFFSRFIVSRWMQSLLFSVVFSLGHVIFCILVYKITLNLYTTFSFFFATLLMNMMFYRYQNIFYTWAMHWGINFSLFGGDYHRLDGTKVNDAEKFNLFLGTPQVCALIFMILLAVTFYFYRTNFSLKTLRDFTSDKD